MRSVRLAASSLVGVDLLSLAGLDCLFGGALNFLASHPLLDLLCHGQESLLNVGGVLGGGLQEGDCQRVGEFLRRMKNDGISLTLIWGGSCQKSTG